VILGVLALLLVGFVAFLLVGPRGERRLERWVGNQIQLIVNGYLNPELTFDKFIYTYPTTVEITEARLVADAPGLPGGKLDVVEADRLLITLAGVPRRGQPIEIKEIRLDNPTLRAVGDPRQMGAFYGFSNLVKEPDEAAEPEEDARPVALSEVFRLRLIRIENGAIRYDDPSDDLEPMELDGLSTTMTLTDPEGGWHALRMDFGRPPLLNGSIAGRLSLDVYKLDVERLAVSGRLGRAYDAALPPALQRLVKQYDVTGNFETTLAGMINFSFPSYSNLTLEAALTDAFLSQGAYQIPLERLAVQATLADRKLDLNKIDIQALGGRIDGGASVHFEGEPTLSALIHVRDIRLEETLAGTRGEGEEPLPYAGRVNGQVNLEGPLEKLTEQARGDGRITLVDGRLVKVPVLSAMRSASKAVLTLGRAKKYDDEALFEFSFAGDRIHFSRITAETGVIALRGEGDIYFDGRLDLGFNGGPLEKSQNMLGGVGKLIGKVTDRLAHWEVTGSFDDVQVGFKPGARASVPRGPVWPGPYEPPEAPATAAVVPAGLPPALVPEFLHDLFAGPPAPPEPERVAPVD
jgi:hypothetical protein